MSNNNIDNIPGISTEVSTGQTFDLTAEEVRRVSRLLNLPELRLEGFSDDESSRILTAIQRYSGVNDDEFTHFLALPTLIYLAHEAAEAAEKDLLEKYRELEDAEVTINNLPRVLDYGDDTYEDEEEGEASHQCTQSWCSTDFLSRLDGLTLAVREAHIRTAEAREERGYLMLKYLWTWLRILAGSSVGDRAHEGVHKLQDAHTARVADLAVARWLRETCPYHEEDWDNGLVWDFILDGRTALEFLLARGAIIVSSTV